MVSMKPREKQLQWCASVPSWLPTSLCSGHTCDGIATRLRLDRHATPVGSRAVVESQSRRICNRFIRLDNSVPRHRLTYDVREI